MLLYSYTTTPRLQYVVQFLAHYYGVAIHITNEESFYRTSSEAGKINYSAHAILDNEIRIAPHALLFEVGTKPVSIDCFEWNGIPAFFKSEGAIPFDLLAAVFFLLSRYEEYGPHQKDMYGRYAHENAIAFKENFLKTPLVNCWLEAFRKVLIERDLRFAVPHSPFSFRPTYDIDMAWSYKAKGFKRTTGGLLRAALQGGGQAMGQRIQVLLGREKDPFDAFDWLDALHQQFGLKPIYFLLVAQQQGLLDKNNSIHNKFFQNLIARLAKRYEVGVHPSWQSGDDPALLQTEKHFLKTHTRQSITASRQHYIRFTLPQTFRQLIAAGITDDYSMGYGSINGFRASVATPFYWYDLEKEKETGLLLHPFCFMDANAYYEQKQTPEETGHELLHYYNMVKAVNGTFYTIWHNSFLGSDAAFTGWRELYERFVKKVCA